MVEEYCWAITQAAGRSWAEADQFPVCWTLAFSWTALNNDAYAQWQLAQNAIGAGPFDP